MTSGIGSISGNSLFSDTMTVRLTGVTDVQKIAVTLTDATSSTSQVLPDTSVSANILIGDVNADKSVNSPDTTAARHEIGMPVGATNFRDDVAVNGAITRADVDLIRSDLGHSLP
ncbi:MAG TPA: hypothetical protein VGG02_00185 [Chthoniobacterales bacterium]